jgi:acetyltransferase-like isoleucine patch superfamily enzyme
LSRFLREKITKNGLLDLYGRFASGQDELSYLMRRAVWRSCARRFGDGVTIEPKVGFRHLETFEIGDGVFIGDSAFIQGRFDGRCIIGNHVWIGPQSYLDARDLVIEDFVGWGPAAKLLGSTHTGKPAGLPVIQTNLRIAPVRIRAWADIGTGAIILPGVTVGRGSVVGAGAVVTERVPPFTIVAGVPARPIRQVDVPRKTR